LIYTEYRENIIIHNIDYFDLCIFATVYTTILNLYSIDVDDVVNEMVIVLENVLLCCYIVFYDEQCQMFLFNMWLSNWKPILEIEHIILLALG